MSVDNGTPLDMVDTLVRRFADAATMHGKATADGNYRKANTAYGRLADAYRQLRALGQDAQRRLLALLNSEDPSVRCWAAIHSLEFAPDQGEPVLEELSQKGGVAGLNAEMTLQGWRAGTYRFP